MELALQLVALPVAGLALLTTLVTYLFFRGPVANALRGSTQHFYGEDARHAAKGSGGFHGFRLTLNRLDQRAVRDQILKILREEGAQSMLRIRIVSKHAYTHTRAPSSTVVEELVQVRPSGIATPAEQAHEARDLWRRGVPLGIYLDGKRIDVMAHHAVFDGVRGVRLLNEILGNLECKGAIRPSELPSCALACSLPTLVRVLTHERPRGALGAAAEAAAAAVAAESSGSPDAACGRGSYHESHHLRVPTALVKAAKESHGLGFAAALQGLLLWALLRARDPPDGDEAAPRPPLHVAATVGFRSDWCARLGSAFNHYGAFPFLAQDAPTPQQLGAEIARAHRRNGRVSGLPCALANASRGGGGGGLAGSIAELYRAVDVLIGGGPLILDGSCGYESYELYKFEHTVPVYVFYATLCDAVDVSVHARVPLPGLAAAFAEGLAHLRRGCDRVPVVLPTPRTADAGGSVRHRAPR